MEGSLRHTESNAVFLSYRREYGGAYALALFQQLTSSGIDVFFDIESIRAGQFEKIILAEIAARPYFLLLLTPGTLNRCLDEGDWLRREIAHALATNRVIVPVFSSAFDFEDFDRFLPEEIGAQVKSFNGPELNLRFFKYAAMELCAEYLVPVAVPVEPRSDTDVAAATALVARAHDADMVKMADLTVQEEWERAHASLVAGDLDTAIERLDELLARVPLHVPATIDRADALRALGRFSGAISALRRAETLEPSNPEVLRRLQHLLEARAGSAGSPRGESPADRYGTVLLIRVSDLLHAIGQATSFVSPKASRYAGGDISIEANESTATLFAGDLDASIEVQLSTRRPCRRTSVALPIPVLKSMLTSAQAHQPTRDDNVEIERLNKSRTRLRLGGFTAIFPDSEADVGQVTLDPSTRKSITLDLRELRPALAKAVQFASKDETQPVLTGVLLEPRMSGSRVVATDSYRLCAVDISASAPWTAPVLVSAGFIKAFLRLSGSLSQCEVYDAAETGEVAFGFGRTIVKTRAIAGEFPSYEGLFPEPATVVEVDRLEFRRSLGPFVAMMGSLRPVILNVGSRAIQLSMGDALSVRDEWPHAEVTIGSTLRKGSPCKVAFNVRYMDEACRAFAGPALRLDIPDDKQGPTLLTGVGDPGHQHLIMPIRIR